MSDRYTRMFAEYALEIQYDHLAREVVHEVKRRILDSFSVALAAFHADTVQCARRYARMFPSPARNRSTIWGTTLQTQPEIAAFVNGIMIRYLDYNDTYLSREPLHPSDMIGAILALGEMLQADPRDVITAIAIGYEIGINLCDSASLRKYRWDHVNYIGIATAVACGKLMGLPQEALEHAISIAIVPHAAMRQTRAGELSMWKGAAASNSARNGLFAVFLASQGMTGPYEPFTGEMGFFQQLLQGESFDDEALRSIQEKIPPRRILDTYIKYWPVEYHAQSAVDAALQIYRELQGRTETITSIRIDTFRAAYEIIAKDPQKWEPRTRETADHSLPYIVVVALEDGEITENSFSKERIFREETRRKLKEIVTLNEDPELTAGYPDGIPNRITVQTQDGHTLSREVRYPPGHAKNPLSDDQLRDKFLRNLARVNHMHAEDLWNLVMEMDRYRADVFWHELIYFLQV